MSKITRPTVHLNGKEFLPVTKEQFFTYISDLDVHPSIVSSWPYRSEWRVRHTRKLCGISQERLVRPEHPNGLTETTYYLAL